MSAISLFSEVLISCKTTPSPLLKDETIDKYIDKNFHLLNEDILRTVITMALKFRDENSVGKASEEALGNWSEVIDAVKIVVERRKDLAAKNFQTLIQFGMEGDQKKVDIFIKVLDKKKEIDHLFLGILFDTMKACKDSGRDENFFMLQYFSQVIESLGIPLKSDRVELKTENVKKTESETENEKTITEGVKGIAMKESHDKLDDQYQRKLMFASDYLSNLIKDCAGDVPKLKSFLIKDVTSGKIDEYFDKALEDNILACEQAGYVNKTKLLQFIRNLVKEEREQLRRNEEQVKQIVDSYEQAQQNDAFTTHHAPKFVDRVESSADGIISSIAPTAFLDALSTPIQEKVKNSKNKKEKKAARIKVQSLGEKVGRHLEEHGWAVVDRFLPLDVVRRVRIEAQLFRDHYEQAEIWVGKQADVGAHLRVPSVRGDRVLWMCGGHMNKGAAVEGVSRAVRMIGELEPCKLEVKAAAPTRRFHALKEVMQSCDKLVNEMKQQDIGKVGGVFERSDVMIANYPGEGSRFARHIDNTTGDGRRITMLLYINPEWKPDDGGALRLTPPQAALQEHSKELSEERSYKRWESDAIDIYPEAGRLAIFYSSEIPHEVLPTFGDRYAITIWYYDQEEREEAIKKAAEAGKAAKVAHASVQSQQEARTFISALMGGDEVGEDGGDPSPEELAALLTRVRALTDESLGIVSSITGAPSVESFRQGFELLVPADLKAMRRLFRSMGMQW